MGPFDSLDPGAKYKANSLRVAMTTIAHASMSRLLTNWTVQSCKILGDGTLETKSIIYCGLLYFRVAQF